MTENIKNIPFSPPDITDREIQSVVEVLKSGWITTGPKTKELERRIAEYIGTSKAVCLNSATAAMEMTLRLLGIGKGDQVITTAYTYTATAAVITHIGAEIVLVDTKFDSYEMDYNDLERKINIKTKAIIPVDVGGVLCNYEEVFEIIERKKDLFQSNNELQNKFNRVIVVADSAHGFGAKRNNIQSGLHADFTCFSFHAVKNLTTAEGGAVVWRDFKDLDHESIYNTYMMLSLHGQSKDALAKSKKGSWEYDIVFPGHKCNMTDIMASIGLVQLDRYEDILKRRKSIINQYTKGLSNTNVKILEHFNDVSDSSGHLFLTRIPGIDEQKRNEIITEMANRGVNCNVHYKPLPLLSAYKDLGFRIKDYTNAFKQYENEITLPLHTKLTDEDVEYVISTYNEVLENFNL